MVRYRDPPLVDLRPGSPSPQPKSPPATPRPRVRPQAEPEHKEASVISGTEWADSPSNVREDIENAMRKARDGRPAPDCYAKNQSQTDQICELLELMRKRTVVKEMGPSEPFKATGGWGADDLTRLDNLRQMSVDEIEKLSGEGES